MASSFHDVRFPDDIAIGASGGPGFKTDVIEFASGKEQRNIKWSQSRMAWDVSHGVRTQDEMNNLIAFFRNRKGRAYGFRFKDWTDYSVEDSRIATGDGTTRVFQLQKWYNESDTYNGAGTFEKRDITRPVEGTLTIEVNNVPTLAWTCDYSTGLVTFVSAPADGANIQASFEFDVPVRFDTDQMKYNHEAYEIYSWGQIMVIELKE